MRRIVIALALACVAAPPTVSAGEIARACAEAGAPPHACDVVGPAEGAAARAGVSAADATDDDTALVAAEDFSFTSRVTIVRDGQTVEIRNTNRPGGNPHSVASSDLGGTQPVPPLPGVGFGGGRAFRSGRLLPGEPFFLRVDVSTMDPAGYLVLPNGDVLVGFHCYIHGASQMSGMLLVRTGSSS